MSKMIKCSTCSEEIASNAKTCPKCGAKVKSPIYKKWWFWAIVAVVFVSIVSGGSNETTLKDTSESGTTASSSNSNIVTYKVGDTVKTKKFEITVTGVSTSKSVGSQYFKQDASDGGTYVIVNWECKNISSEPISSFSLPIVRLSDENNTKYDSDLSATSTYITSNNSDIKVLSDLNPNIKVKDAEVFEISEELYNSGKFYVSVNADSDFLVEIK